jgi:hypothetical protein
MVTGIAPLGAPEPARPERWELRKTIDMPGTLGGTRVYRRLVRDGALIVMVSRELHGPRDWRWHLSISHATRNPRWEEIAMARYDLLPDDVTMGMYLPPRAEYVNVHRYCFHLTQEAPEPHASDASPEAPPA